MTPQMLMVVKDLERQRVYEAFLEKRQISFQTVSSLSDMVALTARQPFSAILIDMPLAVRATRHEKYLAEDALRALPNARLNISAKTGEIGMLVSWKTDNGSLTPSEHLRYCCNQPGKIVFPRNRIPLNLNAELSLSPSMLEAIRTVCIDLSSGGSFLFYANNEITVHSTVWVKLLGLNDLSPIKSTVCWKRGWGTANEIPGIGIHFGLMTDQQQTEIIYLCDQKQYK